jgi:hypothetical protein
MLLPWLLPESWLAFGNIRNLSNDERRGQVLAQKDNRRSDSKGRLQQGERRHARHGALGDQPEPQAKASYPTEEDRVGECQPRFKTGDPK